MTTVLRSRLSEILLIALVLWVTGAQVQCPGSVEARESLATLRTDIDAVAAEVEAITPQRFALVGFTANTFPSDTGVLGFTLACQSDFDAATRMCTSDEVMETVVVPTSLSGDAWVRPQFAPFSATGSGNAVVAHDSSGVTKSGAITSSGVLSCSGWSQSTTSAGLIVDSVGRFSTKPCNMGLASVACCAPAP